MSSPALPPKAAFPKPRVPVAALRKGDRIDGAVFLVETANFKQTRNNKHFIQMSLRDRTSSIKAVRWEATQELYAASLGHDFLRISGRVEEFQQNLQIIVDSMEPVSEETVDFDDFLPASERDPADMERELLESVAAIEDLHIKKLLVFILEDKDIRGGLLRCPAGKTMHHAYLGGLLEHITSLIAAVKQLGRVYRQLNIDVLVAAAVLHDIGKVRELSYRSAFNYTDEGQLLGHIAIGMVLVAEKAHSIPDFPEDLLNHLLHIIASHHGLPEHGALRPPMSPEAIAFHFLDNLDAKLAMAECLKKELDLADDATDQDRRWTDYKPAIGRKLYFP
jgi:3'-5' exoribonuclease